MRTQAIAGPVPIANQPNSVQQVRVKDAAQKFEAVLMGEMLKPLREKSAMNDDEKQDTGNDTYSSYGTEALAQAMVKSGGLGIARRISDRLLSADGNNSAAGAKVS